jgi:pimeloyl-ACP methyl ester carboxylesterase
MARLTNSLDRARGRLRSYSGHKTTDSRPCTDGLAYARFPKEIITPPREWVERVFNLVRWTEMPVGGHFAALEQPRALAIDIHGSFAGMRPRT